jgi:hypothetical protein
MGLTKFTVVYISSDETMLLNFIAKFEQNPKIAVY